MTAFGLSLQEAWTITVPDFHSLVSAHKRIHGQSEAKSAGGRGFTPAEVLDLREAMSRAEREETEWRAV